MNNEVCRFNFGEVLSDERKLVLVNDDNESLEDKVVLDIWVTETVRPDGTEVCVDVNKHLDLLLNRLEESNDKQQIIDGLSECLKVLKETNPLNKNMDNVGKMDEEFAKKIDEDMVDDKQQTIDDLSNFLKENSLNKTENNTSEMDEEFTGAKVASASTILPIEDKPKKRGFGRTLRRVACTIGVALGVLLASKSTTKDVSMPKEVVETQVDNSVTNSNVVHEDNIKTEIKEEVRQEKEIIKKEKEVKEKASTKKHEQRLGDKITLDSTILYHSSLKDKPTVDSSTLPFDQYKVRYIAVISDSEVLDVIKVNKENKNITWTELKKQYSGDVHFQVNLDGMIDNEVVCEQVGWTSLSKIKQKVENVKVKTLK